MPDNIFNTTAYLQVSQAEDYFAGRLNSDSWDAASEQDKAKALLEATRRIDALNFSGIRTADLTVLKTHGLRAKRQPLAPSNSLQPLEFPRDGATTIPTEIYMACCEIAFALLDGVDPELELQNINTTQHGFASLQETYNSNIVNLAFRHGIPSVTAWTYLQPFLLDPFEIAITRGS